MWLNQQSVKLSLRLVGSIPTSSTKQYHGRLIGLGPHALNVVNASSNLVRDTKLYRRSLIGLERKTFNLVDAGSNPVDDAKQRPVRLVRLGHNPFKVGTRVRISYGTPNIRSLLSSNGRTPAWSGKSRFESERHAR